MGNLKERIARAIEWLTVERALLRLRHAGYDAEVIASQIRYKKRGVSGRITVHSAGVDANAVMRLEDRGS